MIPENIESTQPLRPFRPGIDSGGCVGSRRAGPTHSSGADRIPTSSKVQDSGSSLAPSCRPHPEKDPPRQRNRSAAGSRACYCGQSLSLGSAQPSRLSIAFRKGRARFADQLSAAVHYSLPLGMTTCAASKRRSGVARRIPELPPGATVCERDIVAIDFAQGKDLLAGFVFRHNALEDLYQTVDVLRLH